MCIRLQVNGEPTGPLGGTDTQLRSVTYSRSLHAHTIFFVSVHLLGVLVTIITVRQIYYQMLDIMNECGVLR